MTSSAADELFRKYGSTIEGLRQTALPTGAQWEALASDFYERVYSEINVSRLLERQSDDPSSTGYTHQPQQSLLQSVLRRLAASRQHEVHLASNSPLPHVQKAIHALGMCSVDWKQIHSPSCRNSFATKATPPSFFGPESLGKWRDVGVLIDDSPRILQAAKPYMSTVLVNQTNPLMSAIGTALGWVDSTFHFSQVEYLRSKNVVDLAALNRPVYNHFCNAIKQIDCDRLVLVDLGAGLLSMLHLFVKGYANNSDNDSGGLPNLFGQVSPCCREVDYYAFEPNIDLRHACEAVLASLGFELQNEKHMDGDKGGNQLIELVFHRKADNDTLSIAVHLRFWDYRANTMALTDIPHAIVGCCFADLIQPDDLTRSLLRSFLSSHGAVTASHTSTLCYFPITFRGVTQLDPARAYDGAIATPSDTLVFALYSRALSQRRGHNVNPYRLETAMTDVGATLLSKGYSTWEIDSDRHCYLWQAMMYFFGSVAAPELLLQGWDATSWMVRCRAGRPTIRAYNVDLLFDLPHLGHWQMSALAPTAATAKKAIRRDPLAIQFKDKRNVAFIKTADPLLQPSEVRVEAECSLISTGTELKVFQGDFDDTAALDVNIGGMVEERMAYPLSYGYSLVGQVVECGKDVKDAQWLLGRRVFVFAPHATRVIANRAAIQLVPDGVDALDAIFMPSVETAVSIVHDAHIRLGEHVAVFGQGLIGLLVTAVLGRQGLHVDSTDGKIGRLTTIDMLPDRLAMSALMGSMQALRPSEVANAGPFDVAIEVSGNARALQSAIDNVRDGGKIVVASWYGSGDVNLKLGVDFHRSHRTIVTSQVSELPAPMQATWSKQRRFELTWELVRQIKPSLLLSKIVAPDAAQEAYESLSNGNDLAIAFDYMNDANCS